MHQSRPDHVHVDNDGAERNVPPLEQHDLVLQLAVGSVLLLLVRNPASLPAVADMEDPAYPLHNELRVQVEKMGNVRPVLRDVLDVSSHMVLTPAMPARTTAHCIRMWNFPGWCRPSDVVEHVDRAVVFSARPLAHCCSLGDVSIGRVRDTHALASLPLELPAMEWAGDAGALHRTSLAEVRTHVRAVGVEDGNCPLAVVAAERHKSLIEELE
mmetsp:Transcript_1146/g.4098  ORF Transcript_1146/g.4098 Transcript_1146/m.4098 type:complete len:213 (-) Transcript_1146:307-945(-)